jgi:NodT family efflux transporter outer membrane factor (OMF) lipoprotein
MTKAPIARIAAFALTGLLAACASMAPPYQQPAPPVSEVWPNDAVTAGTPAAAEIDWQSFFTDARLRQLIAMALQGNRDLRVAMLAIEQARAQYQIRRADELPSVGAQVSASRAPGITGKLANTFTVGLAVTAWEIDFFGRIRSLSDAALAQYLATEEGRKAAQISLVAGVANTWLSVVADEDLLALTRQTLATRQESMRLARLRFENGVTSELDFRQAESLVESARVTLAQLERQRALDENALVLLIGQPLRVGLFASAGLDTISLPDVPAGAPSDLLVRRPDIRQSEQQLIAANANIGAARAAFFPRISLTAGVGTASNELTGLFKAGSWGFTLAPQLLLPIFDSGRNQAGLASARVGRDIAIAQYERSIQAAFREVADALAGRSTLGDQLQAQRAVATAESARLHLSDLRYTNGVASYLDLLDAQRSLFAVQQALVQTRLAQLQSQVNLYKALGGGWTDAGATPTR